MKLANTISFRVFCYPDENFIEIKNTFLSLLGYSETELQDEKINYKESKTKGFSDKTIIVIESQLVKDKHCNRFLKRLSENLSSADKETMLKQPNRLDSDMNFYIRLDKEKLMQNKYVLTDSGECFHIKINIASFPRRKDVAMKSAKEIFGNS